MLIEADLHEVYGLNVSDPEQLHRCTWSTLRKRINGLLSRPPVYVHCSDGKHWWLEPVLTTRIQNQDDVRPHIVSTRQPTGDMEESVQ